MTKDSLFKMIVPRRVWRSSKQFAATVPCRGKARAERRREARSDAKWKHANEVAAPFRAKIREKNLALMQRAAEAWAARMQIVFKLFGKRAA